MSSEPRTPRVVDAREFRESLAGTVRVIRNLCDAVARMESRKGHNPWDGSKAMSELAEQAARFSRIDGWDEPVQDAYSFGAMTLLAAADYAQGFATLFDGDEPPVFGHLVLARAALEACVVSAWLNEVNVPVDERVRRALCEHLYSSSEMARLKIAADAKVEVRRWKAIGRKLGWEIQVKRGRKPTVGESQRPSVPKGINDLMAVGESSSGQTAWSYLSAVSHVTWYGVRSALSRSPGGVASTGPNLVDVSTQSFRVQLWALYVLRGLRVAAEARFTLMGWADDELWVETCREADTFAVVTIPQVQAALDEIHAAEELPSSDT